MRVWQLNGIRISYNICSNLILVLYAFSLMALFNIWAGKAWNPFWVTMINFTKNNWAWILAHALILELIFFALKFRKMDLKIRRAFYLCCFVGGPFLVFIGMKLDIDKWGM